MRPPWSTPPAVPWVLLLVCATGCRTEAELPVIATVDRVELETSLGATLTAADLDGRVHVVDFVFTSCRMACPMMTAHMKGLYDEMGEWEGLRFLSVSTDPANDTVAVLHEHARQLGVDEHRWVFGRAPVEEVVRLSEEEFLLGAADLPAGHSLKVALVDRQRRIRGYYDSERPEELARLRRDLERLL